MDALFIHTGVNDVENDLLDAETIADHLTKVVFNAREKFPETKLFLSEVTPRSDSLNEKVLKINSLLKNCLFNISNLKLVILSNLADQIYFYDDKHFNRYKGIPSLVRNLKSCYFNRNQISTHSKIFQDLHKDKIFSITELFIIKMICCVEITFILATKLLHLLGQLFLQIYTNQVEHPGISNTCPSQTQIPHWQDQVSLNIRISVDRTENKVKVIHTLLL